jgi:hypothetical protein
LHVNVILFCFLTFCYSESSVSTNICVKWYINLFEELTVS